MSSDAVRVRIAPSPTGFFHVGNARTALFNWLFAHQQGGTFVWRVEDTDRARFVEGALEDTAESLSWLGLEPDEGPLSGGPRGPYYQSQRLALYDEWAQRLLKADGAYPCFCSPERLAALRDRRAEHGQQAVYDRRCRTLPPEEATSRRDAGERSVLRLKMPTSGEILMHDLLRGEIAFEAGQLEDVILVKSDGYPTYHFAVVVDDHAMGITHVLRADEWIPSVPYQTVLYEAFGWAQPVWAHVPMVLNPDGKGKLSKRRTVDAAGKPIQQMTQIREFRAAGYLPEAMFNYLALLGWSYSGEEDIFTREAALKRFRLEDIKSSPAAWDPDKLAWMNGAYIRQMDAEDLAERLLPFLRQAGLPAERERVRQLVPLIQERITTLADAAGMARFLWVQVSPDTQDLIPKKLDLERSVAVLAAAEDALGAAGDWEAGFIEEALRGMADRLGLKAGPAFQPVRVAVTGQRVSPPLFESLELLGRTTCLARLRAAQRLLEAERTREPHR